MSANPASPQELPDIELKPEMTLTDAMTLATRMHRLGEVQAATDIYRRVLEVDAGHADALQFLGIALHQSGENQQALQSIDRSIAAFEGNPSSHLNRGNILLSMDRIADASVAYGRAAELGWNTVELHNNLGVLYRAQNRPLQAEASYHRALAIDPDYLGTHNNLAALYSGMGRLDEAIRHGRLALVAQPLNPIGRRQMAMDLNALGRADEAAQVYRDWLEAEPDNPQARHYLAGCTGVDVPARCPDAYVERTFDMFAHSFDMNLAALQYSAPAWVGAALLRHYGAPCQQLELLDAGCGTGLCAQYLRPYAKTLTGVDLSELMLTKARERGRYDALVKAELTAFLAQHPRAWDLIVMADTLCYFGAIEAALAAAAAALGAGGLLLFTVEASADAAGPDFTLHPHGRYSHRRDYVGQVLAATGFTDVTVQADRLRTERGQPVSAWFVSARRPGAAGAAGHAVPATLP